MKASIYMAHFNKNDLLPNTLFSIARQKVSFPFEVCILDDHSDKDPEPIIRKFLPSVKYRRLEKRSGFDTVCKYVLEMMSDDSDIIIMQSSDVIHGSIDTIERLCNGVGEKQICMAGVSNTKPPLDMYKKFDKVLPSVINQWKKGLKRNNPSNPRARFYFFLGAIRRKDYELLSCVRDAYCDVMLSDLFNSNNFRVVHPKKLMGFHQPHSTSTVPCNRLTTCKILCSLKKRCLKKGWKNLDDYLRDKGK